MNGARFSLGGITITAPPGWEDVTDSVEGIDKPFTLGRKDGVGALQFSPALHRCGPKPSPSGAVLRQMARTFAANNCAATPFDEGAFDGRLALGVVSCRDGDDFIRVWYASDGSSIVLVTYVSAWADREVEILEAESIVRSVTF